MAKKKFSRKKYLAARKEMAGAKQCITVLDYLWTKGGLTRMDGVVELNIMNVPEIVRRLREDYEVPVVMNWKQHTNKAGETKRYGEYSIEGRP